MNSLSPSRPHPSHIVTHGYHTSENTRAIQPTKTLSPIVAWTISLGLTLSLLLITLFGSQPLSIENLTSDFHAGVDGMMALLQSQSGHQISSPK